MKRSQFGMFMLGLVGLSALTGCKSRISKSAYESSQGDPWQCGKCGYLVRSKEDLEGTRCPRCYARAMKKITEEEMSELLTEGEKQ